MFGQYCSIFIFGLMDSRMPSRNTKVLCASPCPCFGIFQVSRDIKILMKAVNSLRLSFISPGFPNDQSKEIRGYSIQSRAVWSQLVEDTFQWRNMSTKKSSDVKFKLGKIKVLQYATKMCEITLRKKKFRAL